MSAPARTASPKAAICIAVALVALPFLQALPMDLDRSGGLVLLLPALWLGRVELAQALARMRVGPLWLKLLAALAVVATAVSVGCAHQLAPALVTASHWVILAAGALIAGQAVANDATAGRRMLAGLALGTAAGTLAVWVWWVLDGRGAVPLYAHYRHLGLHTLAGAIASTALIAQAEAARGRRIFWLVIGSVTWGGLLWSGGRAPVLAVVIALGLWMVFSPAALRKKLVAGTVLQLVAGLALSAAFWTPNPALGWWHAIGRTASAASVGSASGLSSTRTDFWRATAQRALDSPWVGHGPDSYRFLTPKLDGQQPHNVALQLWLEIGAVGALALLILAAAVWDHAWRRANLALAMIPQAWLAVLVASVVAGMLDGVFYHLVAFLPAMLAFGVAIGLVTKSAAPAPASSVPRLVLTLAAAVVALHMGVFYALALGAPPAPDAWTARGVRLFPSTTFGLWRWLDRWQQTSPADVLPWARWAQAHSPNPVYFHVYAARVLVARGDRPGAEAELRAAWDKAHWTMRPSLDAMLRELHSSSP
jgi:O-antigen ligase